MTDAMLVLRDTELVELLATEPELLALSDAYAQTQGASRRRARSPWQLRPRALLATGVIAIAIPAAALANQVGSLLGLYDSGPPVATTSLPAHQVSALAGVAGFDSGSIHSVGSRAGVTFYAAKNGSGRLCFGVGFAVTPSIDALTCQGDSSAFPSPSHPVADFSTINASADGTTVTRLAGFATENVARVAAVADDGSVIGAAPVEDDLYAATDLPPTPASAIIAYGARGDVIFRKSLDAPPTPTPAVP